MDTSLDTILSLSCRLEMLHRLLDKHTGLIVNDDAVQKYIRVSRDKTTTTKMADVVE